MLTFVLTGGAACTGRGDGGGGDGTVEAAGLWKMYMRAGTEPEQAMGLIALEQSGDSVWGVFADVRFTGAVSGGTIA